jgi:hypothetical protein
MRSASSSSKLPCLEQGHTLIVPVNREYATDSRWEYDRGPGKLLGRRLYPLINPQLGVSCMSLILPLIFSLGILFGAYVLGNHNYVAQLLAFPRFS